MSSHGTAILTRPHTAQIEPCWPQGLKTPSSKFDISTSTQPPLESKSKSDFVQLSPPSTKCGANPSPMQTWINYLDAPADLGLLVDVCGYCLLTNFELTSVR